MGSGRIKDNATAKKLAARHPQLFSFCMYFMELPVCKGRVRWTSDHKGFIGARGNTKANSATSSPQSSGASAGRTEKKNPKNLWQPRKSEKSLSRFQMPRNARQS
jgi:hypothetical protein